MKKTRKLLTTISGVLALTACATNAAALNEHPELKNATEVSLKKDSEFTVNTSTSPSRGERKTETAEQKQEPEREDTEEKPELVAAEDANPDMAEPPAPPEAGGENGDGKKIEEYAGQYDGSIRTVRKSGPESPAEDGNGADEDSSEEIASDKTAESENRDELRPENPAETAMADGQEEDAEEEAPERAITPSRAVSLKSNQYLEVTYPGKGWAYIGESSADGNDDIESHVVFFGRKLGKGDTSFTLRSKKAGETLLHFYKNDTLTGEFIDDYLQVTISAEQATGKEKNARIAAPLYADYIPERPSRERKQESIASSATGLSPVKENPAAGDVPYDERESAAEKEKEPTPTITGDDGTKTNIKMGERPEAEQPAKTDDAVQPRPEGNFTNVTETGDEKEADEGGNMLDKARKAFEAKDYAAALDYAQTYLESADEDTDETLFLLGSIWEADSNERNIAAAIDSYESLVKNYPLSTLWKQANQRLIYLKRFYIDIR